MFCDTKGIRLAYDEQGTGLPLVFLHAFPLNRSMWTPQTTALSRQFRTKFWVGFLRLGIPSLWIWRAW